MTKRFGFTLAEVLITLTIIGVIAAMTVPTLLNNTADQEFKTGFKKAVSTLNQAITMQYALEGTDVSDYISVQAAGVTPDATLNKVDSTTAGMFSSNGFIGGLLAQRMQIIDSDAGSSRRAGYGQTNGATANAVLYLSDGMVLEIPEVTAGKGSKSCEADSFDYATNRDGCLFTMIVDVNGDKGKCAIGGMYGDGDNKKPKPKDCFTLNVHPDGVRPAMDYAKQIMYEGK